MTVNQLIRVGVRIKKHNDKKKMLIQTINANQRKEQLADLKIQQEILKVQKIKEEIKLLKLKNKELKVSQSRNLQRNKIALDIEKILHPELK